MYVGNPYIYAAVEYFLDTYSPVLLYSLHQVDSANSDLIRVRRSSDSAESDFNATEISDGTLTTWVGGGNSGYIAKWYNLGSGGTTYDAIQTTASSQPRIVNAGTLDTDPQNGNPSIRFNGSSWYLDMNNAYTMTSTYSQVFCFNRAASGAVSQALGDSASFQPVSGLWFSDNQTYLRPSSTAGATWAADTSTGDFLDFLYYTSSNGYLFRNNVADGGNPLSYTFGTAGTAEYLGRRSTIYHNYHFQFYCHFETDESGNRTSIQDLINDQLSIY